MARLVCLVWLLCSGLAWASLPRYTAAGQLQSENGPWSNDTLTYGYTQGQRTSMTLASLGFGYDYILGQSVSPAPLVRGITLPNSASIINHYDSLSRLDSTALVNQWGHVLDGYSYGMDPLGLRTNIVRDLGLTSSSVSIGYDNAEQITSWSARESNGTLRLNEQYTYVWDKAGNLRLLGKGNLTETFGFDSLNQITNITRCGTLTVSGNTPAPATNVTVNGITADRYCDFTFAATNLTVLDGSNNFTIIAANAYGVRATNSAIYNLPSAISLAYDLNGNLTNDGTRSFAYDVENQLTNITVAGHWKVDFVHDGVGRRRIERDYAWQDGVWVKTNELHFTYDGYQLVQVRDANNNVLVTCTRGLDLSGGLAGAGGIGGVLARTDGNGSTFYHADGAGNVTGLMDTQGNMAARYMYTAFGGLTAQWLPMAGVNRIMFSSKERLTQAPDIYSFGRREWFTGPQRWGSQDPLGERGDINLYRGMRNNPLGYVDPYGDDFRLVGGNGGWEVPGPLGYARGDTALEQMAAGGYNAIPLVGNSLMSAADSVMNGVSILDRATQDLLTGLTSDPQLGNALNNTLAATPLGWPEGAAKLGRLRKVCTAAEGGTVLYRGLAEGESIASGLVARAPGAGNDVISHVAGQQASQWISTTKSLEIAQQRFGQFGVVAIDTSRVTTPIVDVSAGLPGLPNNFMLPRWARATQEVLIQDRVPAEAIRLISGPR